MSVYLLPPAIDPTEVVEVVKRAGVPFEQLNSIRELVLLEGRGPISVATIKAQDLLVLNRYARTLVEEIPTVVMSAPGFLYSGDWIGTASALPAVDWKEIQSKLSKSGHLALTPADLARRGQGAPEYEKPAGLGSSVLNRQGQQPPTSEAFDPETDDLEP